MVTETSSTENEVKLFPNPAENTLYIASDKPIQHIVIRESNGNLVKDISTASGVLLKVDVSFLTPGLYFVEAYSGEQKSVKSVVINR